VSSICEHCGHELEVGDFPFCPHGRGAFTNIPDDVPGGFVVENGFDQPTRFYSHSEHEKALAARGLQIAAKHAGPHDKILSNWAAGIDAVTLANAAELLTRGVRTPEPKPDYRQEFPISVTTLDETFRYKVES
jgi:hypothetical protein